MMLSTSHMLSALSHYTGMVLAPRMDTTLLRRLQLIAIGGNQILVVVVSQTGLIRHRVVTLSRSIPAERLSSISNLLNDRLKGLPLSEVRTQILDHIEAAEQAEDEAFAFVKEIAREAFDLRHPDQELYVDGKENIVDFPDFDNYRQLSSLLRVIEEKNLLSSILEKEMIKGGLTIKIGSENKRPELRGVSLVSSTYKLGDNNVGVLGIMGPRRMEYGRMIALVEGMARIVNQMLTRFNVEGD
jgi:heat-inducible transcriptional repressor